MPGIETIRRPSSVIINTRELQGKFPVRSISFDVRERVMFLMLVNESGLLSEMLIFYQF